MEKLSIKKKTCKAVGCKTKFIPMNSFHTGCSPACALKIVDKKKKLKAKEDRIINRMRLEAIQPRSHWIKKAQSACNAFIRKRDEKEPCISCGRYHNGQYHAGHFRTTGSTPELRFHPSNIHKQCSACNNHLSGNLVEYRLRLIAKVGEQMVEFLEGPHQLQHLTIPEIKEITSHYRARLKELQ